MALTIRQETQYRGNDRWQWSVWLDGTPEELDDVDHVMYVLHHTSPNPVGRSVIAARVSASTPLVGARFGSMRGFSIRAARKRLFIMIWN